MRPDDAALYTAAIVENSDDAILGKDLNGTITSWNAAAERIFGFSAAEAVGQSIRLIVPEERHREEDDVLARLRRGERVHHFETVRQRKDGTRVPVSLTVSPIRTADGRIIGASSIARDITEAKAAEARRLDLQRRLELLVSASATALATPRLDEVLPTALATARELVAADAYAVWQHDAHAREWRVLSSFGISAEFARDVARASDDADIPQTLLVRPLVLADDAGIGAFGPRREAYDREGIRSMLVVPLTVNAEVIGTLAFYYRTPHVSSDADVQVAAALANIVAAAVRSAGLYADLQRGERAASFLAEASAILASSLDYQETLRRVAAVAVPHVADWCAVDIVADDGSVRRLATAHVDPAKVEIARTLEARYPPDPTSPYGVHEVIRTKAPLMMEEIPDALIVAAARNAEHLRLLREIGLRSYMSVPLLARGRVRGVLTFVSAESDRRYTAMDLKLAQDIAARAALAIDNASAYDEARRASQLKDDFLATLSHELRTPLNAVLGYVRMLRAGLLTDDRRAKALEVIDRNATSLAQLVEDVLDVSRIIAGKIRLNVQQLELPRVVTAAIASIQPAADAKGVAIITAIDRDAPVVSGDSDRLQQVVWNLLSNAVKFTPRGGRVHVGLERTESTVSIEVTDTGIGIRPEFLPYVFERFRQADARFAREHGGLGLGLAISRELVQLHGGVITASSGGEGQGAIFRVEFPVTAVAHTVSAGPALRDVRDPSSSIATLPTLAGVHVLVVDDEEDTLVMMAEILQAAGARVTTAASAGEAMARLRAAPADVLVSDIGMPRSDGLELIRAVRAAPEEAVRSIPAAALTAYARSEDRTHALDAGFQLHIAKPIDPTELIEAVRQLASEARPQRR